MVGYSFAKWGSAAQAGYRDSTQEFEGGFSCILIGVLCVRWNKGDISRIQIILGAVDQKPAFALNHEVLVFIGV